MTAYGTTSSASQLASRTDEHSSTANDETSALPLTSATEGTSSSVSSQGQHVGDYVAAGLGLPSTTSTSVSSTSEHTAAWNAVYGSSVVSSRSSETSSLAPSELASGHILSGIRTPSAPASTNTSWSGPTAAPHLATDPTTHTLTHNASCAATWDSWLSLQININNATQLGYTGYTPTRTVPPPSCPEPSVGPVLCQSLRDAYVSSSLEGFPFGYFSKIVPLTWKRQYGVVQTFYSGGYYSFYDNAAWTWPTSAWFGPGCTL